MASCNSPAMRTGPLFECEASSSGGAHMQHSSPRQVCGGQHMEALPAQPCGGATPDCTVAAAG